MGLATLTHENAVVLLVALVGAAWTERPRFSRAALRAPLGLLAVAVLTVAPWTIRKRRRDAQPDPRGYLSVVLVNGETPRFRAPLDPFLLLLAALALARQLPRILRDGLAQV